jgi:hypothetical protein
MKNLNIHSRRIIPALLIGMALCLVTSLTARASTNPRSIVGLWDVHYSSDGEEYFHTYQQWHADGLEFEVNSIAPGAVCQGVFQEGFNGQVRDFHVVFIYDANGKVNGHIEEKENVIVSLDGDSYHGTANQTIFDLNGNQIGQATLTVKATRISLH